MLRTVLIVTLVPAAAVVGWLSLRPAPQRADFVLASDTIRLIDPHRVSWLDEIQVANALFEGLTRIHPTTLLAEPGVAESWQCSDDRRTYTFQLRADAHWSNGDPVEAADFRAAWLRVLDPQVGAQYASLLFVLKGAQAYYRSRLNAEAGDDLPADSLGVELLDARTLRLRLVAPCSYLLDLLAFPTFAPAHRPTLERWAYADGRVLASTQHEWTRPAHIVCNGAFVLRAWRFKQRLWLEKNAFYWDRDNVALDTIEVFITPDPNTALVFYEKGQVDLVRGLPTSVAQQLRQRQQAGARPDFHVGDRFATFFLRVNCTRPPLDNADLRKALSLAIDRDALCEQVLAMGETPASTFVPPGAIPLMIRTDAEGRRLLYDPPEPLGAGLAAAARLDLAREYLRRSGCGGALAGRPLELAYASDPPIQGRMAEAIQEMWTMNLGIPVALRQMDRKSLSARIRDLDYDLARSDWYGDYLDPATFLDMFVSGSGQNRTGWSHTGYDRLIAQAAGESDDAQRFALLQRAEQILCVEELPIVPIYFKRGNFLLNPRFGGVRDNVRDILPIQRIVPGAHPPGPARAQSERCGADSAGAR